MAHYTITIKTLINNKFNFGLDNYPIFNESYRETLNNNILNYYYESEIGFETAELFKFYLNNTMQLIMPKYNEMYKAQEKALLDILGNVDLYEESTRENKNKVNTTSNSNSATKNLFQDTPQGQLDFTELENQKWATNYTMNKSQIGDESESLGNNNEDYERHIHGNNGNKYNIELLDDIKNKLLNIDMLIINELSDLFMGIY